MALAWDLFKHYLLSRRAGSLIRTVAWLCMAGVAIGVMSLVIVISVMNGFNDQIRKRLLAVEPHLVVSMSNNQSAEDVKVSPLFQDLKKRSGLQTDLFENQDVIIRTVDGLYGGAVARGVEVDTLEYILRETRKSSSIEKNATSTNAAPGNEASGNSSIDTAPPMRESADLQQGQVLIGIDLARTLGIFEGDTITLIAPEALLLPPGEAPPFERATVKGLLTTNLADIDEKVIFYGRGRSLISFRNSPSRTSGFEVRLAKPEKFEDLKQEIQSKGWNVQSWVDRNSSLFFALKMEKFAMGGFLALAGLIASFSIVTVLVLLMTQKRKDIGLLMGLGLSPAKTRTLFIRVGLILSAIGIGTGLVLGVIISLLVNSYPIPLLPEVYYDASIPATVEPLFVLGILVVASIIAYLSAWLPARQSTNSTPSEALRGISMGSQQD